MKLVHILPSLYVGGGEKFTIDLCNELSLDAKNDVYLCVLGKVDNSFVLKKYISSKVTLISFNKKKGFSASTVFKLYLWLKGIKPDIVHTHLRAIYYASLSILFLKVPFVHTLHTLAEKEANNIIKKKFYIILFTHFDVLPVSISPLVLRGTKEFFGDQYDVMVSNGVRALEKSDNYNEAKKEIEKYKKSSSTIVFISVGRISEVKNYIMLINAIKELNKSGDDIILLIVGSLLNDKVYADLSQRTATTEKNIYFLGEKSNVGDYLFSSDALCVSSFREGLPLVVLEAMSIGRPVLSTPVGGIPDAIKDGVNGYLSKDVSKVAYTKILKKFISQPLKNHRLIKNYFEEKYTISICMNQYYQIYETLINKHRHV